MTTTALPPEARRPEVAPHPKRRSETGRRVLTLFGHTWTVTNPVFFPDGRHLATAAEDGMIRIYTLSVVELLELSRGRVTRGFTEQEREQHGIEPCAA